MQIQTQNNNDNNQNMNMLDLTDEKKIATTIKTLLENYRTSSLSQKDKIEQDVKKHFAIIETSLKSKINNIDEDEYGKTKFIFYINCMSQYDKNLVDRIQLIENMLRILDLINKVEDEEDKDLFKERLYTNQSTTQKRLEFLDTLKKEIIDYNLYVPEALTKEINDFALDDRSGFSKDINENNTIDSDIDLELENISYLDIQDDITKTQDKHLVKTLIDIEDMELALLKSQLESQYSKAMKNINEVKESIKLRVLGFNDDMYDFSEEIYDIETNITEIIHRYQLYLKELVSLLNEMDATNLQ